MSFSNPLDSIVFITLPDDFVLSSNAMHIDPTIPLPVQRNTSEFSEAFDPSKLTSEMILAGILTILAYDSKNEHIDYYRSVLRDARPNIKTELSEAAVLKAKNEDFDIAEEIFAALRGFDPEDKIMVLNSALFFDERAESYRRSGLNDDADAYDEDAHRYYKEAMTADPAIPDAFFNAGFFYLKQRNFVKAKECFETFLILIEGVSDEDMGENGKYKKERAQSIISDISNRNLDDEQFKAAYDFIKMGQEEKGLEYIRKFLEKNPKIWNAWFLLGWGLRRLSRWEDAKSAFLQAVDCGADNADTYNELAICYMETGSYTESRKCLMTALQAEPENTKIMSNLGFLALREGKPSEARSYFTTVLEFDPNDKIAQAALQDMEA